MMRTIVVCVLAGALLWACEGPVGQEGPKGDPGETANGYVKEGVLSSAELNESGGSWDIACWWLTDTTIVQVFARLDPSFVWVPVTWYLGDGYVRILKGGTAQPGNQYQIRAVSP